MIDADYRGNVGVVLFNFSDTDFAGVLMNIVHALHVISAQPLFLASSSQAR